MFYPTVNINVNATGLHKQRLAVTYRKLTKSKSCEHKPGITIMGKFIFPLPEKVRDNPHDYSVSDLEKRRCVVFYNFQVFSRHTNHVNL